MDSTKRVLYLIDDANFRGGAHVATFSLIRKLNERGVHIEVLTLSKPTKSTIDELGGIKVNVVRIPYGGVAHFVRGMLRRLGIYWYPNWTLGLGGKWYKYASSFDTVCCLGEPSILRWFTASLPSKVRKVVMIHTDYSSWARRSKESRRDSRFDAYWYSRMDCVAEVGCANAKKMKQVLPQIADKITPFHNLLKEIAGHAVYPDMPTERLRIVSLGRLVAGAPKCIDKMIRVAARLKDHGCHFEWVVYGEGEHRSQLESLVKQLKVDDLFKMPGYTPNPHDELAKADLSVMLSDYEGLSNGIYEAMMLGVPVFSTKVGGAEEQIEDGVNGWLVENDEEKIFEKLKAVLSNRETINAAREALKDYHYDNDKALKEHLAILGIEE